MVSRNHKGLIRNPNGTFSRTPQYETWNTHNDIQLKDYHESTPKTPEELLLTPYHPKPTRLKLNWSYDGEWVLVPKNNKEKGPDFMNYRIGRVERYIDTDGKIKRALSYGEEDIKLTVWYRLDEMFQAYPLWNIPKPCKYYNGRKFNMESRRIPGSKPTSKAKRKSSSQSQEPGDQSKDIQGKRGQRGTGQYQPRGRGISTSRGGGRPSHKDYKDSKDSRDSGWEREYREWDELQATGSRTHRDQQRWEEDSWREYKEFKDSQRPQRESYRNPEEGYYTVGYEERKRARSPSPRRHDRRDYSPRYEHERGRGRGGRNYSPDERDSRRYPSHDR